MNTESILKRAMVVALVLCLVGMGVSYHREAKMKAQYEELSMRYVQLVDQLDVLTAKAPAVVNPLPQEGAITNTALITHTLEELSTFDPLVLPEKLHTIIGVKNNNPCNVKKLRAGQWAGQLSVDKFSHVRFSHPIYGLRAAAMTLISYQKRYGLKTLESMMSRYAEGNVDAYTTYLSKRLGLKSNEEFDVIRYLPQMVHAIVTFECGTNPYPKVWFDALGIQANVVTASNN